MSTTRVVPWIIGNCSFYAIERDGICLPDEFMELLHAVDADTGLRLLRIINTFCNEEHIREVHLRPERPERGVFALYNHSELRGERYNRSRLLCTYVGNSNRIMLIGSGFLKSHDEPIQRNRLANTSAEYLADIAAQIDQKIDYGDILVVGSELIATRADSFELL